MKFTSERMMPGILGTENGFQEHIIRYDFATQFCRNKVVLDIGCGSGYGSHYLKAHGAKSVYGIDLSHEAIDYCREKSPLCHFKQGNATSTKYEDNFFDVIVCFELIEHLKEQEELMSEIKRILKKDGILIMSTPNKDTFPPGNPFHVKELTEKEYLTLLNNFFKANRLFYEYYPYTLIIRSKESDSVHYLSEDSLNTTSDFFVSISTNSNKPIKSQSIIKEYCVKTLPFTELEKLQKGVSGYLISIFRKIKKHLKK